ncbi:MAG: DUF1592 domain-containing protein, partial [Rubripirellula sp.]|nr:DUF1592 domain-containing protein [Rubripirellula sp.]
MIRIALLLLACAVTDFSQAESPGHAAIQPFLKSYCIACHGQEKQRGDRRFDLIPVIENDVEAAELLQEVLDQLNLSAMPPEDEPQPSNAERKEVVALLTTYLAKAREGAREHVGKVVMRRLNRAEYRNTIRDLFHLKMVDFDPTITFPADDSTAGFDNVGEGLVTSDYLLRSYLEAARKVANKGILPGPQPQMIHYQAGGDAKAEIATNATADKDWRKEAGRLYIKFRQPLGLPLLDKKRGVPADGEYIIRFTATAVRRNSRYKDEDLRYNSKEPMRLSISIDSRELGATAHRIIGEYEIPDDKVIEIEHRVWLEKGFTFHLHWANGPNGSFKRILRKVLPKYNKDALYPIRNPPEMYVGSGHELHVHALDFEGPFYDQWPPAGFAKFFPDPPRKPDANYLNESLMRVASSAFRRPVSREELSPYLSLAQAYFKEHDDFWAAAKYGVRAILTSPKFLYLAETTNSNSINQRVSDHELSSRLSYFLWSSMPDDELRATADRGTLSDPKVLRSQVERMLSDPKSFALTENFTGQWLSLRKLGEMPPDPEKNQAYYEDKIEAAMRQETQLFFAHVLSENRSILEFIDSDYTFLNPALARHYGIPELDKDQFYKVSLRPDSHRGGLLGQGSILTATSNGVETQPVVRGIWVLENILGTPPSPPPPDVEPLDPDVRGAKTTRDQLKKHRETPT